jgi:hypothetical protein
LGRKWKTWPRAGERNKWKLKGYRKSMGQKRMSNRNFSLVLGLLALFYFLAPAKAKGQAEEAAQLLLNVEKLAQLKEILSDLEKGYMIVNQGLGTVKELSEGNFNLHRVFLDGLLKVSPAVKNYHKVGQIIDYQLRLVREYRDAFRFYLRSGAFEAGEIQYLEAVYTNLFKSSLKNLDELLLVLTANSLRMDDDERLRSIDRIYAEMEDKLSFLRVFNGETSLLAWHRGKESRETRNLEALHGLDK